MSKITIKQALEWVSVSESTLRRAIRNGEVSATKDDKGRNLIDIAELERVYELKPVNEKEMADNNTAKIVELLEEQVTDLKEQITELKAEKTKILDMLSTEQEKTKQLMLITSVEKQPLLKRIFRFT